MSRAPEFECDVTAAYDWPRLRFNFANGWSASIVVRTSQKDMDAMQASLAACPTGKWGTGQTDLGETEATADEAIAWLHAVSLRPRPER